MESKLACYIRLASNGKRNDIELIMNDLKEDMTFADSSFIDYALGLAISAEGVETISRYLFECTQIQRNYCTLFFNRGCEKGDWEKVRKAYGMGLIDAKQAFSK